MPFKPGQSGNPAGRPKEILDLKRMCREMLPEVIEALRQSLTSGSAERVQAANTLLAYGFGKPVARVDHRIIRSVGDLTEDELSAILAAGEQEMTEERVH